MTPLVIWSPLVPFSVFSLGLIIIGVFKDFLPHRIPSLYPAKQLVPQNQLQYHK